MRILIIISVILTANFLTAQEDKFDALMSQAKKFKKEKNYTQARYYYELARKHNFKPDSIEVDELILKTIISMDSTVVYDNACCKYLDMICKGDSLLSCNEMLALKTFDDAYKLNPIYAYPTDRIDYLLDHSKEIQKQLLIFQAHQKRVEYQFDLNLAQHQMDSGTLYHAYNLYNKIKVKYHFDTIASVKADSLEKILTNEIALFEKVLAEGDELYFEDNLTEAKIKYEYAQSINPDCYSCKSRVRNINYLLEKGKVDQTNWEELQNNAIHNFDMGNYDEAQYQFLWLYKHDPTNETYQAMLEKIETIQQDELEEKNAVKNAQLLLERADSAFLRSEYKDARELYQNIMNRYSENIDYLLYVKERIKDCNHYIDQQ